MDKELEAAKAYAAEDDESPKRGALYFMVEDGMTFDEAYWAAHKLSDDECVAICQAHGALQEPLPTRPAPTHILDPRDDTRTLCGLIERRELDPVLSYDAWVLDSEETCVACEAALTESGLEPRG